MSTYRQLGERHCTYCQLSASAVVQSRNYREISDRQLSFRCRPSLLLQISRPDIDLENKVFSRSIAKILTTCTCPRAGLALAAAARRSPLPLRPRARAQARVVDRSALERAVFMVLSPPRASHAFELTLPTAVLLTAASLQPCPSPASIRAARLRIVAPAELLILASPPAPSSAVSSDSCSCHTDPSRRVAL